MKKSSVLGFRRSGTACSQSFLISREIWETVLFPSWGNKKKSCLAELQKGTFQSAIPKGQSKFIFIRNSTTSTTHCSSTQSELSLQRRGRDNINKRNLIRNEQCWDINPLRLYTAYDRDTNAILSRLIWQRFFFSSLIWGYAHVEILQRYANETTTFSFINHSYPKE